MNKGTLRIYYSETYDAIRIRSLKPEEQKELAEFLARSKNSNGAVWLDKLIESIKTRVEVAARC